MATPFHAELVTPERVLFSGEVDEISMRTDDGEIAFLAHHEDYLAAVDITVARLSVVGGTGSPAGASSEGEHHELRVALHGGFVQVDEGGVTILAGVAELGGEIDLDRTRRALAEAEAQLAAGGAPAAAGSDAGSGADADHPVSAARPTGAVLAILAPESPDAASRRARARLEAAGAS